METKQFIKYFFNKHYDEMAKKHCNTCCVGTWAINHLEPQSGAVIKRHTLSRFLKRLRSAKHKQASSTKRIDKPIRSSVKRTPLECKILVVSKGCSFSKNVMSYAIKMATKTKSGLVALNLDEQGINFHKFSSKSEANISDFSDKAIEAGVRFSHVIQQGAEDSVVAKMHCGKANFRYVMDDIKGSKKAKTIPVYTRSVLRSK